MGYWMNIDWQIIIETAIGSASGAGVIVLISYFIDKRKELQKNFNDAILIQLDLHKMLAISLAVKKSNKRGEVFNEDMQIINFGWMLTQFLTFQRGRTRLITKKLADAQISYQKLQKKVDLRKISNEIAIDYADAIENAIEECFQAFRVLYDYIENTFDDAIPVKLGYKGYNAKILKIKFELSNDEMEKYFDNEQT